MCWQCFAKPRCLAGVFANRSLANLLVSRWHHHVFFGLRV